MDKIKRLRFLSLYRNGLTGAIPTELANIEGLSFLSLHTNGLTGPIPAELGNLGSLIVLNVNNNDLSGWIPPELGNLSNLEYLGLSNNNLTGKVPPELGKLIKLQSLTLSENLLTGALPSNFVELANLANLGCRRTEGVCIPATDEFRGWARQVESRGNTQWPVDIPSCDEIDSAALSKLYQATNGDGWTRTEGWLGDEGLSRWHGVRTDSIGRVSGLDLSGNGLSGQVPDVLGQLANLRSLRISDNMLNGRLPLSLTAMTLEEFDYKGTSLCVADDAGFADWLSGIPRHSGTGVQCPPLTDREILKRLYRNTDGPNWDEGAGWLTDAPLSAWHGVDTDAAGQVIELQLRNNSLSGVIPAELGQLAELRELDLAGNALSGSIPPELGNLAHLESLALQGNQLSGSVPPELGQLSELRFLILHENFVSGPIPPELVDLSRLERLWLHRNQLNGSIPSKLGELGSMRSINLAENKLGGIIPPQFGILRRLAALDLSSNRLTGTIPAELGDLADLRNLRLFGNDFSGPIPARLGDLANLVELDLGDNELSGSIPAELGRAYRLEYLDVRSNALTGPVPPEFGKLTQLRSLILAYNPGLGGPLPPGITALGQLERFMAGETGLCRPADAGFDSWFGAIPDRRIVRCEGGAKVYLTQAVQSWDDPVPLLAREPALLRVFVTAPRAGTATLPDVLATFFVDGTKRHTVNIAGGTQSIPMEVTEGDLAMSANTEVPASVIVPGLEMVIEVDPRGVVDPALGVTKRIPVSGRLAVDVRRVPPFRLTLIPLLWEAEPDPSVVEAVSDMAADPNGHELLRYVRTLMPIEELLVVARDPVITSTQDIGKRLSQVEAIRIMEGGSGYWMGVFKYIFNPEFGTVPSTVGIANVQGWASVSILNPSTIAHELGHNLSLRHSPCGGAGSLDPWFPHSGGSIGAWGYDFERRRLVPPDIADVMGFCPGENWISDYFFNKALRHHLANDGAASAKLTTQANSGPTLLLWGGRDKDGVPYLDPAFVVDAMPTLPDAAGEYSIEGANAGGVPIFSYTFDMPVLGDAEGEASSFVFALPLQP
ncbi:MAG: M66 family metalloprotease [Gemmatimonadetes bacterium]|nr:M66 family metalloprotease [Gemmatimonadota bacterium]